MRPLRVEMEGFGAFRDPTTVDFTGIDLVALVGDTGAGKSTIIDAITFALYGEVARYGDARLVAPAINQTSQQAKVRLDFDLAGQCYTAVRVVRRTKNGATTREARLERAGENLAEDAAGMTRTVEGLLGLTADQFNRTVVLPQGRFADFLHDKPANRQETLRKLLGLEMYQRIGVAARTQANALRERVNALQPEVDARAAELTDEHRDALRSAATAVTDARTTFDELAVRLRESQAEVERASAEAGRCDERIALLESVEAPLGVDALDAELVDARTQHQMATGAVDTARAAVKAAQEAAAAGPDIPTVRLQIDLHDQADALSADHDRLTAEVAAAQAAWTTADARVTEIRAEQTRLDGRLTALRREQDAARTQLAQHPSAAQIDAWLDVHRRAAAAVADAETAQAAVGAATSALEPLTARRAEVVASTQRARDALDAARRRAGIAAYASMLAVGEPCPLCLQEVHTVASHTVDDEVEDCDQALTAATAAERQAMQEWEAADVELRNATALANAAQRAGKVLAGEAAALEPVAILQGRRAEVEVLTSALDAASTSCRRAEVEAEDHRGAEVNRALIDAADAARLSLAGLSGNESTVRGQLTAVRARLEGVASRSELTASMAVAVRLSEASAAAAEAFERADADCMRTTDALRRVEARIATARDALDDARDRVVVLSPPPLPRGSLADGWHALIDWTVQLRAVTVAQREDLRTRLHDAGAASEAALLSMRAACERALVTVPPTVAEMDTALTRREAETELAIAAFDERLAQLVASQQRLERLAEEAAVANALANLLRADGFEAWLMEEALEGLVERATERLHELSGGQYSLVIEDRVFWVRDHANADELRSVKTLSGGETFLASLSLALALSDATAALAPEGAPELESIFLDEGFGTLDPQTLDSVASAIEELGASGRLVGLITHIRELAERMPVRLEVTKAGGSAHIVRVEA